MSSSLKIVHVASEVNPYTKTGGVSNVVSSLSSALVKTGNKIVIVTPFYERIIDIDKHKLKCLVSDYPIQIDKKNSTTVSFWQAELMPGLAVYFIGNQKYFSRRKELYGSRHENARFYLFDKAVIELLKFIKFKPDILHCHDWQTGLIHYLIKKGDDKK